MTQLRKGVLEYCVLAQLEEDATYGLELAGRLVATRLMSSEGTVYPLLSRLRRLGWVETTWRESPEGPPRRYYELTASGRKALTEFRITWRTFAAEVDSLIGERH